MYRDLFQEIGKHRLGSPSQDLFGPVRVAHQQEHVDLIESIRRGKPPNELRPGTERNLTSIMGRMAVYTGKRVTWGRPSTRGRAWHPRLSASARRSPYPRGEAGGPTR